MNAPAMGPALAGAIWQRRGRRAARLLEQSAYAAETMRLYQCLLAVQQPAHARALAEQPEQAQLGDYITARVAPAVAAAVAGAGIGALALAARPWLCECAALDVGHWLAGEPLPPVAAFFARASAAPVLEALAGCGALPAPVSADAHHCPACGGLPQVAFTGGGEQLVTAPQRLRCARCSQDWTFPRLRCIACGESDTAKLCSFAAESQPGHLRVDACQSCRSYWIHVELRAQHEAVPDVDELAALPLDLHAQEHGFCKIVPNLMGIG